jgi:MtrB/PioB family decaheme-associated outer membrane protein
MKLRFELLMACAVLVIGAGSTPPARAADMITKAPPPPPVIWWYEGYAEIGGRFYLNDPDKTKLGKFYEYRDLRPGVFGNFYFGAHRTGPDPFDLTASGFNIGWDDQAYELNLSKPGAYYLTFDWDETPHVYAKDAKTTYSGTDFLTTPKYPFFAGNTANPAAVAANTAFVNANSNTFDLGYRRDTASGKARWTPDDNWDINASYSHMHRTGTQPQSAVTFAPPAGRGGADQRASIQFAKPVDDTTQNGSLKAEYAGSSPWGKPFNVALGYGFSLYDNSYNSVTFQNPWIAANTLTDPLFNRYSLWPDNQAQTANVSAGIGLPLNSRYMGTFQYSLMTQDQTFLPSTSNPLVAPAALTRNSLDGDARTLLSNNVLHTQITSDLQSTLRYKYYDYHSNQSPITITGLYDNPDTNAGAIAPLTAMPLNFNKQNASAQLDYRPWKWLNVGVAWEWERWLREINGQDVVTLQNGLFDATTNENAVKAFLDSTWGFSTLRASIWYGQRRLDGDYINALTASNNNAFREVDIQDRNSTIGKASWSIVVVPSVTVTPVGGFRTDDYPADGVATFGITKYESWNAGGDITWVMNPMARFYISYIHENGHREVYQSTVPSPIVLDTTDYDDSFMVGGKFTLIPDKLFLNASYSYIRGTSKWVSNCGPGGCLFTPMPTFPDTTNTNHRVDTSLKYVFDESAVKAAGLVGKPFVKARVIWEKNENDSWQTIEQQLGMAVNPADATMARSVFFGISNPNYNVFMGILSLGWKW